MAKVGVIGSGAFGSTMSVQLSRMKGIKLCIISDINPEKAKKTFELAGFQRSDIAEAENSATANVAMENNKPVVTKDTNALLFSDIDIVVDATGIPEAGCEYAFKAIMNKKHVVMVNVEADALAGPILKRLADNAGVVYSLAYGDQPALIKELYDFARSLSLEVIAAGKGTKYTPHFKRSKPEEALKHYRFTDDMIRALKPNAKMYNSFIDGTKSAIEMVAVSNMTGLKPDVRGMRFPTATVPEIPVKLSLKADGGILDHEHVVECISSLREDGSEVHPNITQGIFVIVRSDNPHVQTLLPQPQHGLFSSSTGRNVMLYRPYHILGIEAPYSVLSIVTRNEPTGAPIGWYSDVIVAAKRDINAGETLDGEGGYAVYGLAEDVKASTAGNCLPMGLANGLRVRRAIKADEVITYDDIELNEGSFALSLRRLQESMIQP
jgi:predicted homoserine dehydrogenase-like protein